MLEAKDYKIVDQVSPFFRSNDGQVLRRIWQNPITKIFVIYVDIFRLLTSHNSGDQEWDEIRLSHTTDSIKNLKILPFQFLVNIRSRAWEL